MSNQARFILTAIVVIAVIAALAFVLDRHPAPTTETTATSTPTDTGTVQGSGYTIEQVPEGSVLSQMPDPNRPVKFDASVSADVRASINTEVASLASAIEKNPTDVSNWLQLAVDYHSVGDFDGARAVWEGLLAFLPGEPTLIDNLGRMYELDLHDYAKAEQYFNRAIAAAPTNDVAYVELHELYKSSYKVGTGADIAIDKKAIAALPNNLSFMVALGDDYLAVGDSANAKIAYQNALAAAHTAGNTDLVNELNDKLSKLPQ